MSRIAKVFALLSFLPIVLVAAPARRSIRTIGAYDHAALMAPVVAGPEIWKDPSAPQDARVNDLVSRLSLAEKAALLSADAAAIPRLGIPAYSFRNECLHGLARTGIPSTVFPEPIGMAATWDPQLIHDEAAVIATEARAQFNDYTAKHDGNCRIDHGISFYSPNLNLFRDPRWGRGQETYGEDPFLIAQFGVAYIRGLQGNDPKYIEALACAKHYAVHSGPEPLRTYMSMNPTADDLHDTYLPAFEAAVRDGHVGSVMGAYSALYGIPDCANSFLLTDVLRKQWGFTGFVVSDGGAIRENWEHHHFAPTPQASAADAVKAGCDLFSGRVAGDGESDYQALGKLLQEHLLSEKQIDAALTLTLAARFRLGLFDPPSMVPFSKIGMDQNNTPAHRALALKVAEESIVLLKNDGLLPLDRANIKRLAVIGPNADATNMIYGNYSGFASQPVSILEGIRQVAGSALTVDYVRGCPLALKTDNSNRPTPEMTAQALAAAKSADAVIFVSGIDSSLEREGGGVSPFQGFDGGDRTRIELPSPQEKLLKALYATGKPVILINCSGSAMAIPWEAKHLAAILQAWYPGEEGGRAVGEVLFGDVDPAGRLPVTFYGSTADLPDFQSYSMSNRTYRYFRGSPVFAFGHGLSYTTFEYSGGNLDAAGYAPDRTIKLSFRLKNTGGRDGDEVAQVYYRRKQRETGGARMSLCGFERIHLAKGQSTNVSIDIPAQRFRHWDTAQKRYVVDPGTYELLVGAASDDIRFRLPLKMTAGQ